jgi:hypothetical protein
VAITFIGIVSEIHLISEMTWKDLVGTEYDL